MHNVILIEPNLFSCDHGGTLMKLHLAFRGNEVCTAAELR